MATGLAPADFDRDPNAAFMKILRDAREPLTARKVIDAVAERGVARPTVSRKWESFRNGVARFHPNIHRPGKGLYRWRDETDDDGTVRAARERQFRLDTLHAVADLAGEVEELAYDSGDPDLIVERLRARVRATALEQVGRPGEEMTFDPARHEVQGKRPADGAAVTVVRPGYASAEGGTALVLRKALVVAD
jgi:hypothetical protein